MKTDAVKVAIWPCGTWCPLDETRDLQELRAWMGDDYYVVDVTEWDEAGGPKFDNENITEIGVRCGNHLCVECYGVPDYTEEQVAILNAERKMGELSIKVDTSAVSEAIRQVLEVSDTSRILIELLARRDAHGKAKYGTSLDRTDLSLVDWLQHQTEELLDGAGYAQAAKREAERLLRIEAPLRKLIEGLQESPPRIHNPSLRTLVDLL